MGWVLLKMTSKVILRATWFCNTCLGGKVPGVWRFVRITLRCGRTSSSIYCHRT
ncbi:hypothetical protein PVAP13_1KG255135 [Panicum virgatum]|uniref:Uncharacterized protein n=1 Tax=Panicum virgatum TaxID=38727 RepID=A0A8T0XGV5_PANVG|nr:hypothetical protein PVAP13_1KG255135 [Panicum virgatum]